MDQFSSDIFLSLEKEQARFGTTLIKEFLSQVLVSKMLYLMRSLLSEI